MNGSLYREAALDADRRSTLGRVALYAPPHHGWLATAALLFAGSVVLFLYAGSYTARERASGDLLPEQGVLNIVPPTTGIVTQVFVRDGQEVERGAPLLAVSSDVATGLGATRALIAARLQQQRTTLELDLGAQSALASATLRELHARNALLAEQVSASASEIVRRRRQAELAREKLARWRTLREKGYVSNGKLADEEATVLDAEVRVQEATGNKLKLEQEQLDTRRQLAEAPLAAALKQRDIQRRLGELDQQMAANEEQRESILRAPRAGTVAALLVHPGRTVAAGEMAVALLPKDSTLQARLLVPSRAIGFVREGDRVVLRYQAYPFQKFGVHYGRVVDVSRTALSTRDVGALTGNPDVRGQYYRVVVAPDRQDIEAYGRREPLRAGMSLDADILLERRRLVEWLFEPLYAIGRLPR
ncbi:HlyD family secretion protein [Pseudomonas chlororaphis]|uniref:Anibiotic ABC transporter n=1 Tax=Pseudomonas chlororaphis TaxID=587753 RepID=A0A1Q8ENR3_9PSED|nr:HlyD family efflux transporter periplasmic adaptor subunit [Pseudomonas chlororaphis]OLF53419.1 anibiotic ABC transporter [Pseudomonas chlororaphis]